MSSLIELSKTAGVKDFDHIPIIDLSPLTSSPSCPASPSDLQTTKHALAAQIRSASLLSGFFYLSNPPVPAPIIADVFEAAREFFDLPLSVKEEVDYAKSGGQFRGYVRLLEENQDPSARGELHEAFNIGLDPSVDGYGKETGVLSSSSSTVALPSASSSPSASATKPSSTLDGTGAPRNDIHAPSSQESPTAIVHGQNLWPSPSSWPGAPHFKHRVLQYYTSILRLGQLLFPLFALAMDLPEAFFEDKTRHPAAIMRLLRYPGVPPDEVKPEHPGIGAHTDFECFTILCQHEVSGLQVQNKAGEWIDAPYIPGTFVVNLGDQFARWTNDIFVSTRHRVLPPLRPRYSIPFFFGTDYDVPLIPPASCVGAERPNRYEHEGAITAGEYVKSRYKATYA